VRAAASITVFAPSDATTVAQPPPVPPADASGFRSSGADEGGVPTAAIFTIFCSGGDGEARSPDSYDRPTAADAHDGLDGDSQVLGLPVHLVGTFSEAGSSDCETVCSAELVVDSDDIRHHLLDSGSDWPDSDLATTPPWPGSRDEDYAELGVVSGNEPEAEPSPEKPRLLPTTLATVYQTESGSSSPLPSSPSRWQHLLFGSPSSGRRGRSRSPRSRPTAPTRRRGVAPLDLTE